MHFSRSMPSAAVAGQRPTLYVPAYFLHLALRMAATTGCCSASCSGAVLQQHSSSRSAGMQVGSCRGAACSVRRTSNLLGSRAAPSHAPEWS